MDIEQKQVEHIDYFVKQALNLSGSALQNVVVEAISHPSLFALSEILWSQCPRGVASRLPQLVPEQILKLKQLIVLTLADTNKVLPYETLMPELYIRNVRELEDFLINDCMYVVQFAAGRDLRSGQVGRMIQTLASWLSTSDNLLVSIQGKIKWTDNMSEIDKKHRKK